MTKPPLQAALYILGAILLAGGTHLLIWRRWIREADLSFKHRQIAGKVLTAAGTLFPVGMLQLLLMRHVPRIVAKPLMTTVFTWVGLTVLFVLATPVIEILRVALSLKKRGRGRLIRGGTFATVGVAVVGVVVANTPPAVVTTQFEVSGDLAGYRIVQLTDLHIGPTLGRAFAEELAATVNGLHPDLIVISGDMVDGSVRELTPEVEPLKSLAAREGVVFVLGNHEYLSGVQPWMEHVNSFGWHVLRNTRLSLAHFDVVGLDDPWESPKVPDSLLVRNPQRPVLAVAHQPQSFAQACRAGVDVALAGHTHGGQIFPFGIVEQLQQGYLRGAYSCGRTHLYVSSGAGYWGPPMRLGSSNEITVIELN